MFYFGRQCVCGYISGELWQAVDSVLKQPALLLWQKKFGIWLLACPKGAASSHLTTLMILTENALWNIPSMWQLYITFPKYLSLSQLFFTASKRGHTRSFWGLFCCGMFCFGKIRHICHPRTLSSPLGHVEFQFILLIKKKRDFSA